MDENERTNRGNGKELSENPETNPLVWLEQNNKRDLLLIIQEAFPHLIPQIYTTDINKEIEEEFPNGAYLRGFFPHGVDAFAVDILPTKYIYPEDLQYYYRIEEHFRNNSAK